MISMVSSYTIVGFPNKYKSKLLYLEHVYWYTCLTNYASK